MKNREETECAAVERMLGVVEKASGMSEGSYTLCGLMAEAMCALYRDGYRKQIITEDNDMNTLNTQQVAALKNAIIDLTQSSDESTAHRARAALFDAGLIEGGDGGIAECRALADAIAKDQGE